MNSHARLGFHRICFSLQDWKEISKQIHIKMKLSENDHLFALLHVLDKEMKSFFTTWENLSLEEKTNPIELVLQGLVKLASCSINQNCHMKLKQFIEAGEELKEELSFQLNELKENQSKQERQQNAGLFGLLPYEIILLVAQHLNGSDLIALASTSHYLSTNFLRDPACLLNLLISMSARDILKFTKRFFRPTDCDLYKNLKQSVPQKLQIEKNYKTFLCYALLTDNIHDLSIKNVMKLLFYIRQDKQYQSFVPCISGILHYLKKDYKKFYSIFLDKRGPYGYQHKQENHYLNFAGACFTNYNLPEIPILFYLSGYSYDLRSANLENTNWKATNASKGFNYIIFNGANLGKAIFKNSNLYHCDFFRSGCENTKFENITFDMTSFKETYLEGALFIGIGNTLDKDGARVYTFAFFIGCDLKNVSIINSDLKRFYFHFCNIENIHIFDIADFASTDSLTQKLDSLALMLSISNSNDREHHRNFVELRHAFANNIMTVIKDLPIDIDDKISLLKCAIGHCIFEHRDKTIRKVQAFFGNLFFDDYEVEKTESQKILVRLVERLEREQKKNDDQKLMLK